MCRLFGFRSNVPASIHPSLVTEKNSLKAQSVEHKDGWGIAYYGDGVLPEVAHGLGAAHQDPEFERVSSLVSSHTALAHVRLASIGKIAVENTHPFLYGPWAFAHNGTITGYEAASGEIEGSIDRDLLEKIRGQTDSERCFYLFLTYLRRIGQPHSPGRPADIPPAPGLATLEDVARALALTTRRIAQLTDRLGPRASSMNFLVTDGVLMAASRRSRTLFFSERKKRSSDPKDPPPDGTRLSQLVIASEELSFEDHWHPIPEESVIGVDGELRLRFWTIEQLVSSSSIHRVA